jgi:hypothetical protein
MRRNLYALVVHTTKSRQEMLEDVDLGDGNGAFKAIYRSYYRNTTGGYQAAILAFYAADMAKDEVDIMGFGQLITRRAKQLIALGGQPVEKDKITVLLNGLRPDFALCKTQLKMKTMAVSSITFIAPRRRAVIRFMSSPAPGPAYLHQFERVHI